MGRKKKVTVKPLANTRLKPLLSEKGEAWYPLYVQISYNRLTTRIPTRKDIYVSEKQVLEGDYPGSNEVELIRDLAIYEATVRNPEFTVRGFASVYLAYTSDFVAATKELINNRLHDQLQRTMSFSEYHLYARGESDESRRPAEILGEDIDPYTKELQIIVGWIPWIITVKDWVLNPGCKEELSDDLEGRVSGQELELILTQIDRAAHAVLDSGTYV